MHNTFHSSHQSAWTKFQMFFFILYRLNCLWENDCWQKSVDSKGIYFVLQTDQ